MRDRPQSAGQAGADRRQDRGRRGEELARRRLERGGYTILETNFRSRYGEIDIIAGKDGIVAFIEVKARLDKSLGEPFEAVTPRKQSQIRRMAENWLQLHQSDQAFADCDFRFDVISVLLDRKGNAAEYLHQRDAFR